MNGSRRLTGAAFALAGAMVVGGCYHAVIETGRAPSGTVIEDKWADSFIDGLAPPDVVNTAQQCPNGVARVETEHSFLNLVAAAFSFGIYTPMHITVHCAAASTPVPDDRVIRTDARGAAAAVDRAARLSAERGGPAYVVFED